MKVIYTHESFVPAYNHDTIFLAGPTPRKNNVASWRPEAMELIADANFKGYIINPEFRHGRYENDIDIDIQIEWEGNGLMLATCILFWIPRNMNTMPGLTTNDEWGTWKHSGKVVLGAPDNATHIRYQKYYAKQLGIPFSNNLFATVNNAVDKIKNNKLLIR